MPKQRELWAGLVHPTFGGPVMPVSVVLTPGTTGAEYVIFVATRDCAVRRARVAARADLGAATATLTLENVTDSEDISSEMDVSSSGVDLSGNDSAEFVLNDNAEKIEEGDILVVDYDSDTDPSELVIVLEIEFLEIKED